MKNKEVEAFYMSTVHYCNLIENWNNENFKLKTLLSSLLDLYSKALYLPNVEAKDEEVPNLDIPVPQIEFSQYNDYWKVFDPYQFEEPVAVSLTDDILDIYKDVKRGIHLYEKDEYIEAVSEWKINFEIHWGSHAVDSIRVLHSVIFR